jgi:UDP-N-acetyl-2-amino-2-deoxyglucuronate dehydrogenase
MVSVPDLRVAIIGGAGGIAGTHLSALAKVEGAVLAGIADIPPAAETLKARAAEYGVPWFTDHREMLETVKPDLVSIVTPHPLHCALAEDAFAAGCHVLTEKPIAVEAGEADRMIAAAARAKRLLAVNYQKRYWSVVEHMKRLVDAGAVGRLIRVLVVEPWYRTDAYYRSAAWRGTWAGEGGGVLMNQAPHTLDLLCHLTGRPKRVWGWVRTRFHAMECEDSAQAMFEYADGAPGYLTVSTVEAGVPFRLQVCGDRGGLELVGGDLHRFTLSEPLLDHMRTNPGMWEHPKVTWEKVEVPPGGGGSHVDVYRDLLAAIREGRDTRISGVEALASLELANAITLSSFRDGVAVELPVDRAAFHALLEDLKAGRRSLGAPGPARKAAPVH